MNIYFIKYLQENTYNTLHCRKTGVCEFKPIERFVAACLIVVLLNSALYAQPADPVSIQKNPFHIQLQYAGNMGLGSVGIGKSFFNNNLSLSAIYGYLPKKVNTVTVHTLALKTCVYLVRFSPVANFNIGLYTGLNAMYGITENTFVKLPSHYPKAYYPPTALHASFLLGLNHNLSINKWKWTNLFSVFTEIGTMEYQIYNAFKNENVHFADIVNISAGISIKLAKVTKE
jgi:hypothetical protein